MPLRRSLDTQASAAALEAAAADALGAEPGAGGRATATVPFPIDGGMAVTVTIVDGPARRTVAVEAAPPPRIPWFGWFVAPFLAQARVRAVKHAAASVVARAQGDPAPKPPGRVLLSPPVPFTTTQLAHLLTVSAVVAVAGFGSSLFTQQIDYIGDSFQASDRQLGVALAITRLGFLASLFAATLADRLGRRRILLASAAAVCGANLMSALAPELWSFSAAQVVTRGAINAVAGVAAVAVVEDAPERARAWAIGILGLAGGLGFGVAILFLPLADLDPNAWRALYVVSAAAALILPVLAKGLPESPRFTHQGDTRRGRIADVLSGVHRRRFTLLAVSVFAGQVFIAPASQFANRYLQDERGFDGLDVTIFRTVTAGVPGLLGVLAGGYLADTHGRKPVTVIATIAATAAAMVLFVSDGWSLWVAGTASSAATAMAAPAAGAFGTELFPTRFRATAQSLLLVVGVAGSALGLLLAGGLSDPLGDIGRGIAVLGVVPIVALLCTIPRLPESAARDLDDVSEHDGPARARRGRRRALPLTGDP